MRQQERKYAEAESLFREALAIRRRLLGNQHGDVARTLNRLAAVLKKQGGPKAAEANKMLAEAEKLTRQLLAERRASPDTDTSELITILGRLNMSLGYQQKYADAEPVAREIVALERGLPGDNQQRLGAGLYNLANMLRRESKFEEAETASAEALALWRSCLPREQPGLHALIRVRASVLDNLGRFAEAETLLRESLAIQEEKHPESWEASVTRGALGGNLLRQEKPDEAEPLLLAAYEGLARQDDDAVESDNYRQLKAAVQRLVQLYEQTGKPAQVAEWKQKLAALDQTDQ